MTTGEIIEIGKAHNEDMMAMGWSDPRKSDAHYKMLVIDEICEAIQAHRRGNITYNGGGEFSETIVTMMNEGDLNDSIFKTLFERYYKDTTTDELADAFLRLLSLSWMRGYEINTELYVTPFRRGQMFTETAWGFVRILMTAESDKKAVQQGLTFIIKWCEFLGIDLYHACKRKMRYNRMRHDWKSGEKKY